MSGSPDTCLIFGQFRPTQSSLAVFAGERQQSVHVTNDDVGLCRGVKTTAIAALIALSLAAAVPALADREAKVETRVIGLRSLADGVTITFAAGSDANVAVGDWAKLRDKDGRRSPCEVQVTRVIAKRSYGRSQCEIDEIKPFKYATIQ